ncbi:MAG: restriction endonuclease subunit S [Lachnospiraceae bacterium]|nr:restriction endonuclease subunit S [Lachnospiraceae bacterium]
MGRAMKDSGVEWIGEIPEAWNVFPMKSVIISNDGGIWGNDPVGDGTDKVVIRSTEQSIDGKWQITSPATRNLSGFNVDTYRILPGDLLITKSSGSAFHIGKTTIADQYFAEKECYYSNFIQRVRVNQFAKYYWYILNSTIARDQFVYLQNTTSGIGNINAKDIEKIYVPLPSIDEQYSISRFLDEQCAKIDTIIAKALASIEEYKHLKQAVITQTVTKGVRGERPMKDSGIAWIGKVPENWDIINL